jgi:hypothetical protein
MTLFCVANGRRLQYCFFCWDGGTLYDCFNCPRAVCRKCVIVPAEHQERIDDEDVRFICPGCHEMRGKGRAEMRGKGRAEMRGKDPQKDSNPLPMTPYFVSFLHLKDSFVTL